MKLLIIVFFAFSINLQAQSKYKINLRSSLMNFTLNEDVYNSFGPGRLDIFGGACWANEISASARLLNTIEFNVDLSTGFVHFWSLGASAWKRTKATEYYIPIRIGVDYKLLKWLRPSFELSNYLLLSRKRGETIITYPNLGSIVADSGIRSLYSNLDLGFKFVINTKSSLTLSTPITLRYMYRVRNLGLLDPNSGLIEMRAGNAGINLQYSYEF
jgi:hypothetical protein